MTENEHLCVNLIMERIEKWGGGEEGERDMLFLGQCTFYYREVALEQRKVQ